MQILVFITKHEEQINPILSDLLNHNICGGTVFDAAGMLKSLNDSDVDPPPVFGALRKFINPGHETVKMLMLVLDQAGTLKARKIIRAHAGDLSMPNSGILFEIPIQNVEGVQIHNDNEYDD